MKKLFTALFLLFAFSLPQLSYANSCSLIKAVYESGKYERAFKLAKTHATYNNTCAEYYLGLMYIAGQGVKTNSEKGYAYLESAAKKGYQPAIDFFKNMPF